MKKVYLFIAVIIFSGFLILSTFSIIQKKKEDVENIKKIDSFIQMTGGLLTYSNNSFINTEEEGKLNYKILNPIDGIYYSSEKKNPISIEKTESKTSISIEEGIYVFVLNDIFEKYEILGKTFKINQLGKGIFFINNIQEKRKFYSYNSMLNLELLDGNKAVTSLRLFPSFLMNYYPENNSQLNNADILRVLVINPLYYIDAKTKDFYPRLSDDTENQNYVKIITKDISNRYSNLKNLYSTLLKMDIDKIKGDDYISKYSYLFVNKKKRDSYYINISVSNFLDILKNFNSIQEFNVKSDFNTVDSTDKIVDAINKMSGDLSLQNQALTIIKNYYYLSYFGTKSDLNDDLNSIMKKIFVGKVLGGEYFSELSNIYFSYYFGDNTEANVDYKNKLDLTLSKYLKDIQVKKILKNEDYLNFSFFVIQYAISNFKFSNDNLDVILLYKNITPSIITYFDSYYNTLKGNEKAGALSIQFYYLSQLFDVINSKSLNKYFEKITLGDGNNQLDLKRQYLNSDGTLNITSINSLDFRDAKTWHENMLDSINKKKIDYYNNNKNNSNSDSFINLEKKLKAFSVVINMIMDYNDNKFKKDLNKNEASSESIVNTNKIELSRKNLENYLKQFNGLDLNSLNIKNIRTINSEGFYDIEIGTTDPGSIGYSKIDFKLDPNNKNTISKIILYNNDQYINKFSSISIPLDEKEDSYKGLTEDDSYKGPSFSDFFMIAFNENISNDNNNTGLVNNTNTDNKPKESREASIFKQEKLIEGDFTFINNFLNIPFYSLKVEVSGGKYDITLDSIPKQLSGLRGNYMIEISAKYDFSNKFFYNINLKVINGNSFDDKFKSYYFDGKSLIINNNVNLKTFSQDLQDLGLYIDIVQDHFSSNISEVKFDLNTKKVYLDSNSFDISKK